MSQRLSLQPSSLQRNLRLFGSDHYSVMLTEGGSGYSRWGDLAITRRREDPTRDHWGSYVLLCDLDSSVVWAPDRQPYVAAEPGIAATFQDGVAEFAHADSGLNTTLEVAVASDCDAEVRRITLHNSGKTARNIELTSYAELVLAAAVADEVRRAHEPVTRTMQMAGFSMHTLRKQGGSWRAVAWLADHRLRPANCCAQQAGRESKNSKRHPGTRGIGNYQAFDQKLGCGWQSPAAQFPCSIVALSRWEGEGGAGAVRPTDVLGGSGRVDVATAKNAALPGSPPIELFRNT